MQGTSCFSKSILMHIQKLSWFSNFSFKYLCFLLAKQGLPLFSLQVNVFFLKCSVSGSFFNKAKNQRVLESEQDALLWRAEFSTRVREMAENWEPAQSPYLGIWNPGSSSTMNMSSRRYWANHSVVVRLIRWSLLTQAWSILTSSALCQVYLPNCKSSMTPKTENTENVQTWTHQELGAQLVSFLGTAQEQFK